MNDEEYKQKIINHFKSGTALMNEWDVLAEICLQASDDFSPEISDQIDKAILSEQEYQKLYNEQP
jgi:hypothetical protein